METAGDHEVKDEPEIAFHPNGDALANAPQLANSAAFGICERWLHGPQQECAGDARLLKRLADDARFERGDVCSDIREFGHSLTSLPGRGGNWQMKSELARNFDRGRREPLVIVGLEVGDGYLGEVLSEGWRLDGPFETGRLPWVCIGNL